MCEHKVETKVENGVIITYCSKCGQILDTKQSYEAPRFTCENNFGGFTDNGGQILHG